MALLLGCALNISSSTVAIAIVALGTSLPDAFTSRCAAQNSKYADAAIGNIMGANSVNVYLGVGISWIIASLYYKLNYD